jgi:hypothetical protein
MYFVEGKGNIILAKDVKGLMVSGGADPLILNLGSRSR